MTENAASIIVVSASPVRKLRIFPALQLWYRVLQPVDGQNTLLVVEGDDRLLPRRGAYQFGWWCLQTRKFVDFQELLKNCDCNSAIPRTCNVSRLR